MAAPESFPRALSEREGEILWFLLSVEGAGMTELRAQSAAAHVRGRCPCGCATVDLAVDRTAAPRSLITTSAAISALSTGGSELAPELICFLDEGWLSSVEIVYYEADPPTEFPAASTFAPPILADGSSSSRRRRRRVR